MNLPRWSSTTKIIVSFLNAELNATAVTVDRHRKAAGKVEAAGWMDYRGKRGLTGNAKSVTCSGKGAIKVYGTSWSRSEESVK